MTGEILFLAHRIPFPPDRGDKIRSHHLLRALARMAPVHVGTFGESAADMAAKTDLDCLAESSCVLRRRKPLGLAGLEAVVRRKPVSLTAFHHEKMARFVSHTLATRPISAIVIFSGQMGQYVPRDFAGRVIVDLCDVDSAKFEAYGETGALRWINRREARLLACEEERLARRADATLLISDAEAALFRGRLRDPSRARLLAIGNGIDTHYFDPARVAAEPGMAGGPGPHLLFTGQMDYRPNIEAVQWMAQEVMPHLRETLPEAAFHIVGRAPTAAVSALSGRNGVRVWGAVADVRPFLAAAVCVVAPLRIARGVQNKVLEAMAMARPVVLTAAAATGIDARDGEHFRIALDSPVAFAEAIANLTAEREAALAMGSQARRHVEATMCWDAVLAPLANLVAHGVRSHG